MRVHGIRSEPAVIRDRVTPVHVHIEHGTTERLERPEEFLGTWPDVAGDHSGIEAAPTLKSDHRLDRRNTSVNVREYQKTDHRLQPRELFRRGKRFGGFGRRTHAHVIEVPAL